MRYYGGKSKLLEFIGQVVNQEAPGSQQFADLFAGTGVVASHFRQVGMYVQANDILYFSYCINVLNLAFECNGGFESLGGIRKAAEILNELPVEADFITMNFTPIGDASRAYFTVENGMKIDTIRTQIEKWVDAGVINSIEKAALIGLLLKAINRVSNVTGTYGAYLKTWDPRSLKPLILEAGDAVLIGPLGKATNCDIFSLDMSKCLEISYLDPPYNNRDYASNYFLLELIATGWFTGEIKPQGVTGMVHFPHKKSAFSSKRTVDAAFRRLFEHINSKLILLSYSDEGLLPISYLVGMMSDYGKVEDFQRDHKRFRSINQDGAKKKLQEHILVLRRS